MSSVRTSATGALNCSFCSRPRPENELVQGPVITICHDCVEMAWDVVRERRGLLAPLGACDAGVCSGKQRGEK